MKLTLPVYESGKIGRIGEVGSNGNIFIKAWANSFFFKLAEHLKTHGKNF